VRKTARGRSPRPIKQACWLKKKKNFRSGFSFFSSASKPVLPSSFIISRKPPQKRPEKPLAALTPDAEAKARQIKGKGANTRRTEAVPFRRNARGPSPKAFFPFALWYSLFFLQPAPFLGFIVYLLKRTA